MINIQRRRKPDFDFKYTDSQIREMIKEDFLNKCYLCEESTRHFEIDHFHPKVHFPELENEWGNLFCICQKCNKIKPKDTNTLGKEILDNCKEDAENSIKIKLISSEAKIEITNTNQNPALKEKVLNTIRLLDRIYNGIGSKSKLPSLDLKKWIAIEIASLRKLIEKCQEYQKTILEEHCKKEVLKHLKKDSSFYTLKKWLVKDTPELNELFGKFID